MAGATASQRGHRCGIRDLRRSRVAAARGARAVLPRAAAHPAGRRRSGAGGTPARLAEFPRLWPRILPLSAGKRVAAGGRCGGLRDQIVFSAEPVCARVRAAEARVSLRVHLQIAGGLLLLLSLAHGGVSPYFRWKQELGRLSLLTRQMFLVHTFFIALTVALLGGLSLFCADSLLTPGPLSRAVLA